jgi:DNA-binding NarL/FixJ family response regulator
VRLADMLVHRTNGIRVPLARLLDAARAAGLPEGTLAAMLDQPVFVESVEPRERCPLTPRQLELIRSLAEGKHYKEIAAALGLAPSTIRSHLHEAYRRLGVADRAQAVLLAAERGWIGGIRIAAATG